MFDLYLLPIHLRNGQEFSSLAGFQAYKAPRRCERSRAEDVLLVRMHLMGGEPPGTSEIEEILGELAQAYYTTRGPVTTSLRAAVEAANQSMLSFNGRKRRGSEQSLGILNLAALRHEFLYLAHSGPARTFLFAPDGFKDFYNPAASGRGLGLSDSSAVTFFQCTIKPESIALFFMELPPSLAVDALNSGTRPSLNILRRRLLSFPGVTFLAGAVQFKNGTTGEIHLLRPRPGPQDTSGDTIPVIIPKPAASASGTPAIFEPEAAAKTEPPAPQPVETLHDRSAVEPGSAPAVQEQQSEEFYRQEPTREIPPEPPETDSRPAVTRNENVIIPAVSPPVAQTHNEPAIIVPVPFVKSASRPCQDAQTVRPEIDSPPFMEENNELSPREILHRRRSAAAAIDAQSGRQVSRSAAKPVSAPHSYVISPAQRRQMASAWQRSRENSQKFSAGMKKILARILPGTSDQSPQLSPAAMLFIALAVPRVVVILATTVYMRRGQSQQHEVYLAQAQQLAVQASSQSDDLIKRSNYEQALRYLDQAESFGESEASQELRKQVYQQMDGLDKITRLQFSAAYTDGFAPSVNITRIAASDTEAYLLDSSQERVLRLFRTGRGYDLDSGFQCGGIAGSMMGSLVDIVVIPDGGMGNVLGVDAEGNLITCGTKMNPLYSQLPTPEIGWGRIQAMTLDQGNLYVLDPAASMVYIFWDFFISSENTAYAFFNPADPETGYTPPDLTDVIDLAVDNEEVYLLRDNGSMITCHSGVFRGNESHCVDPALYGDTRAGADSQALIFSNTHFTQMQLNRGINPAVYVLDTVTPSVFRFSLKLNLDSQFRSSAYATITLPDAEATAFGISQPSTMSPGEVIFLAFGHELFYADLR